MGVIPGTTPSERLVSRGAAPSGQVVAHPGAATRPALARTSHWWAPRLRGPDMMWLLAMSWLSACVRYRDAAVEWDQPFPVDAALSGRQCHPHLRIALIYVEL
eukprot:8132247-Pyramimonas_sp.AAC.1